MGGGGGPTKTFTLRQIGGKTPTDVGPPTEGQVDQSNTFLFDLLPDTTNPGATILRVSRSTAPTDGTTPWTGDVILGGVAPSVDGDNDDNGINAVGITTWEMSDDGTQLIFGRVPSFGAGNNEGLVIARLGENLTPVQDKTAFALPGGSGIGRNVAVHPDGSSAFAIGNFGEFPTAITTLDVVKYTLSETVAPTQAAFTFSYVDTNNIGMGASMDMGGNFLVLGPTPGTTLGNVEHLAQLFNIDSDGWNTGGETRGGSFNFDAGSDNDGRAVRITSDGEHVLYTSPGNTAPGSFRVLKTTAEPLAPMEVESTVNITVPQEIVSAGNIGDIETIDSEGNILVVIDSLDNDPLDPAPRLLAYAGQPDNLQLINNIRWGVEGQDIAGATISSIKITRAAVNTSLTDGAIKSPQPEENVLVTVTGTVDNQGNVGVITFNLDN